MDFGKNLILSEKHDVDCIAFLGIELLAASILGCNELEVQHRKKE